MVLLGLSSVGLAITGTGCVDSATQDDAHDTPDILEGPIYPEGTVLAANGQGVTAEEVDRFIELMSMVEPANVKADNRRKSLANIWIPVLAARAVFPEERLETFQIAQELLSTARETGDLPPGVEARYMTGTWADVGMVEWLAARATAPGGFSELVENPGSWTFMKVLAHGVPEGQPFEPTTQVTVQIVDVPFFETENMRDLLLSAIDQTEFEVIDPAWETLVPPYYLYKKKPIEERYR